tara:strand:- start:910 stop:2355 length:1446 start_codon:yes stop_codon:yes gene_type:complete
MKYKYAFISGHFNVLHSGHIRLFKFAKDRADKLIVAVESNKIAGNTVSVDEKLRIADIETNSLVDIVVKIDKSVKDVLLKFKPDIVIKGNEFENKTNVEKSVVESYGGKLIFTPGALFFNYYDTFFNNSDKSQDKYDFQIKYLKRHNIKKKNILNFLNKIKKSRVLVIGDSIIDKYTNTLGIGMSQEDPSLVVSPIDSKIFLGGALIVASHVASLGAKCKLITLLGDDGYFETVSENLSINKVEQEILIDNTRPTTFKERIRCEGKTLLRINKFETTKISNKLKSEVLNIIKKNVNNFDIIIFSDFNYGFLTSDLIKKILKIPNIKNKITVADSQTSSQIGDILKFKNINLITPTEHEARNSLKNTEDGLILMAEKLRVKTNSENIFLKLGKDGLLIHSYSRSKKIYKNDRLKPFSKFPLDTAGAGDSMLVIAALALHQKLNIWEAAYICSMIAGIQVNRIGNTPLQMDDIFKVLKLLTNK